ncbi:cyclin-dependent kinase 2-associated protein 2 isoform X1 [Hippocampus comes]|uniref:cyclin-dependent kinase 2-associated protein 2 isoform X1 n=1 Tax=Hippocampus comes TaxID=109280 RepID=UPI00094EB99D|nr:PREDICTED: cyclin-dependent kinase 2-associated protein 2 isoform X1 [Hippocampus comes]
MSNELLICAWSQTLKSRFHCMCYMSCIKSTKGPRYVIDVLMHLFVSLKNPAQPVKVSQGSTYSELLSVIEEMSREIRPTYAGSKSAMERLKRGIIHARALVRECLAETERSART